MEPQDTQPLQSQPLPEVPPATPPQPLPPAPIPPVQPPAQQPVPTPPSSVPPPAPAPPLSQQPAPVDMPPVAPPEPNQGASNPPGTSAQHLKPVSSKLKDLFEHDPDEVLIGQINKHSIGLVFIYGGALMMFLMIMVVVYFVFRLAPDSGFDITPYSLWIKLLFGAISFFILLGGYVAGWVYQRSALVLTSEKLVQLTQRTIFDRKVSQLAIGDVQDVTVDQTGVLSRIFGYGSINIETSGEQYNYSFDYAPYPHEAAKEIVSAHERNIQLYGN